MKITGDWITRPETRAVCDILSAGGYQALFVGGCVRNALLGAAVADIDIATDAHPDRVMDLAVRAGLKPVPTGIDHGTVTVVSGGLPHEITSFRADIETFGRHAQVVFGQDIVADARRRDFTMNALYARPDGSVVDPLGGIADLRARRVRFIEDPARRIREDYLRILRFFRFHAWYGDPRSGLDPEALAACVAAQDGLAGLSRERVGAEMRKLLAAPDPAPALAAMQGAGILQAVLPGADARAMAPLVHLESETDTAPDAIRRLALLGGEAVAERLRLSRAEDRRLDMLRKALVEDRPAAELGYRHGIGDGGDILLVRAALVGEAPTPETWQELQRGAAAVFPVKPADLMPGLAGPALGARLRALEARWIASGFMLGREDLL
ncbi:CCA tRNA nucleotidyltransferase [Roseovarius autotrophicus]|uniref:CCA tRNA nucleotidyltransferase n=1 Tax=Roseovarius autotrophicus TaxID=2824121 RepID=UPI0019E0E322|nr:CCA tRNA nucleotidyltransferase [Roseovarius autotrophicus]MBE0453746.1 CCA tRNA nucleotidyltransferase [Roseovarius sp.]